MGNCTAWPFEPISPLFGQAWSPPSELQWTASPYTLSLRRRRRPWASLPGLSLRPFRSLNEWCQRSPQDCPCFTAPRRVHTEEGNGPRRQPGASQRTPLPHRRYVGAGGGAGGGRGCWALTHPPPNLTQRHNMENESFGRLCRGLKTPQNAPAPRREGGEVFQYLPTQKFPHFRTHIFGIFWKFSIERCACPDFWDVCLLFLQFFELLELLALLAKILNNSKKTPKTHPNPPLPCQALGTSLVFLCPVRATTL